MSVGMREKQERAAARFTELRHSAERLASDLRDAERRMSFVRPVDRTSFSAAIRAADVAGALCGFLAERARGAG